MADIINDSYREKEEVFQPKLEKLLSLVENSRHMTVFTGAGVSTLSGIPDFRGSHGVYTDPWQGMDVEDIISMDFFHREPGIFYRWAKDVWYRLEDYEPNIVHKCIALLEKKGYLDCVYTQNIDMLHQRSGSTTYEIHGSPAFHHCTGCRAEFAYSEIAPKVLSDTLPVCPECGSVIKPDIVFYGENLNEHVLDRAWNDFSSTDLCLVLGSSLVVQPAASLPLLARQNGADVVIVNAQPTYQDRNARLHFNDLRQTFEALYSHILNKQ